MNENKRKQDQGTQRQRGGQQQGERQQQGGQDDQSQIGRDRTRAREEQSGPPRRPDQRDESLDEG